MNWHLLVKIFQLRKNGFLRFRRADMPVRLECLGEACPKSCCRFIGPPQVTQTEGRVIGIQHTTVEGGAYFLRGGACGCCRLGATGLCLSYELRPKACQDYPWYNIDGKLLYDAGCPGLKFDVDGRPNVLSLRQFRFYLSGLPQCVQNIIVRLLSL